MTMSPKDIGNKPNNLTREVKVIILSGEKDIERAIFGFAYALAASAMGFQVTVFLAMEGAVFANADLQNRIVLEKYYSVPHYLDLLEEFNVRVVVCSSCIESFCEAIGQPDLATETSKPHPPTRKNIEIMGITSLISLAGSSNTVVF